MGLRIIIEDYEGDTTIVPLEASGAPITVGRQEGNTIQLAEQNVSRAHARFVFDAKHWVAEDLNSYNGIRVNGVLVDEGVSLEEGDVIQVGDYRLLFCSDKNKSVNDIESATSGSGSEDHRSTLVMLNSKVTPEQILASMPAKTNQAPSAGQVTERVTKEIETQRNSIAQVVAEVETTSEAHDENEGMPTGVKATLLAGALAGLAAMVFFFSDTPVGENQATSESATLAQRSSDSAVDKSVERPELVASKSNTQGLGPAHRSPKSDPNQRGQNLMSGRNVNQVLDQKVDQEPDALSRRAKAEALHSVADATVWPIGTVLDSPNSDEKSPKQGVISETNSSAATVQPLPKRNSNSSGTSDNASEGSKKNQTKARSLLQKAREASVAGKTSLAYRLAKQSYNANRTSDALLLMGLSSCKMGKKTQAKGVLDRLQGANHKNMLRAFCSSNGIDLG